MITRSYYEIPSIVDTFNPYQKKHRTNVTVVGIVRVRGGLAPLDDKLKKKVMIMHTYKVTIHLEDTHIPHIYKVNSPNRLKALKAIAAESEGENDLKKAKMILISLLEDF